MKFIRKTSEWRILELGDLFDIARGGSPRPIKKFITDDENGVNWVKIGDTKNVSKYIYSTKEKIIPEGIKKSQLVVENDFILSNSMSFGRPYIMKTRGCIHDGWLLLRSKSNETSIDFMYYLLSSDVVKNQFKNKAAGSTVRNLNIPLVSSVQALIPPYSVQQKIANILSCLDEKIQVIDQQILKLQELKKGLMQKLFAVGIGHNEFKDSSLGKIPINWKVKKIKDFVIDFKGGAALKPKDFVNNDGYPVIPKKAISSGGTLQIDAASPTFCTHSFAEGKANNIINKDYIVTTLRDLVPSGPSIGYMVTFEENKKYILAQGVYGFKLDNQISRDYIVHYSNTINFRKKMQRLMVGSTQVHIRNQDYLAVEIPFPSYQEQLQISQILNSFNDKVEILNLKKTEFLNLKKGLMQKLLTGKVGAKNFKDF